MIRWLAVALFAASLFGQTPEASARKAMANFLETFNSKDVKKWSTSLNYPHVRLASNNVRVYNSAEDFVRENGDYVKRLGVWDHSKWESMKAVQQGAEKVHFAVVFVRYEASGKLIGKFPSFYVVTLKDGHWGVQARSSFAP